MLLRIVAIVGVTLITFRVIGRLLLRRFDSFQAQRAVFVAPAPKSKAVPTRRLVSDIQRQPRRERPQPAPSRKRWLKALQNIFPVIVIIGMAIASIGLTQAQRGPDQPLSETSLETSWPAPDWPYRITLHVNPALVAEDMTDFPVLASITEPTSSPFAAAVTAGTLMFTDTEGHVLAHEIEHYDAATGTLLVWVKMPHLSATTATPFHLYFGKADAVLANQAPAVWSNGYVGVYRVMSDATSTVVVDSTKSVDDPFYRLTVGRSAAVPGKVGMALRFDSGQDVVDLGQIMSGEATVLPPLTISAWVYPRAAAGTIVGKRDTTSTQWQFFTDPGGYLNLKEDYSGRWPGHQSHGTAKTALLKNFWQQIAVSIDASGTPTFYNDGLSEKASHSLGTFKAHPVHAAIGARWSTYPGATYNFIGDINLIRISSVVRTAGWLQTERDNQAYPTVFVSASAPVQYSDRAN